MSNNTTGTGVELLNLKLTLKEAIDTMQTIIGHNIKTCSIEMLRQWEYNSTLDTTDSEQKIALLENKLKQAQDLINMLKEQGLQTEDTVRFEVQLVKQAAQPDLNPEFSHN